MERLDPAVEDLRRACEVGDLGHRQAGVGQRPGGATGADELAAYAAERTREFGQSGLVIHTE